MLDALILLALCAAAVTLVHRASRATLPKTGGSPSPAARKAEGGVSVSANPRAGSFRRRKGLQKWT